jgi:hypothetical protein
MTVLISGACQLTMLPEVGMPENRPEFSGSPALRTAPSGTLQRDLRLPPRTGLPTAGKPLDPAGRFFGAHVGEPARTAVSAPILVTAPGRLSIMNGRPSRSCGQFAQTTKKHAQAFAGYAPRAAAEVADHW